LEKNKLGISREFMNVICIITRIVTSKN